MRFVWMMGLVTSGCVRFIELEDEGIACIGDVDLGQELVLDADAPVEVMVRLESCGSGCATNVEASCTATEQDGVILVRAEGSYELGRFDQTCPSVCVFVDATCETEALPEGTYTLRYGVTATGADFDVPGTIVPEAPVCSEGRGRVLL